MHNVPILFLWFAKHEIEKKRLWWGDFSIYSRFSFTESQRPNLLANAKWKLKLYTVFFSWFMYKQHAFNEIFIERWAPFGLATTNTKLCKKSVLCNIWLDLFVERVDTTIFKQTREKYESQSLVYFSQIKEPKYIFCLSVSIF